MKRIRWKTFTVLLLFALVLPRAWETWWVLPVMMIVGFCLPPLFPEFDD